MRDVAQKHFDCPSLAGVPLEDNPYFKGILWEARVMGPEVMSAGVGAGVGEPYLSDITLAFLEDTGQYMVDYKAATSFTADFFDADRSDSSASFVAAALAKGVAKQLYTPPSPQLPATARWGRGAGCSFVSGAAAHSDWSDMYQCTAQAAGVQGCSYDGRYIAECGIHTNLETPSNGRYTCGFWTGLGMSCVAETNPACSGGTCRIPPMFRPYATDAEAQLAARSQAATSASTGGASYALDFVPTRANVWACQSSSGPLPNALGAAGYATVAAVPGQTHCDTCRCFQTSFTNATAAAQALPQQVATSAAAAAGCFRANCYLPNYLQIGVHQPADELTATEAAVLWTRCPAEGGDLVIPGFRYTTPVPSFAQEAAMPGPSTHTRFPPPRPSTVALCDVHQQQTFARCRTSPAFGSRTQRL